MSKNKDKDSVKPENGDKASFPTLSRIDSVEELGTQIGPYKLLSVLGEGGFGIVYRAEQKKPVRRQVALKVIKPGMDSKQVIGRFEAERQALALLDHPNIAHIFDGGTTEAGRPYFVMELVKGLSITEYCDQNKLSIEERLELFRQVCEAVQHAHRKGIIHRDIKPSNILVPVRGGKPVPMIIDFGVAKAISQPLTERTLFTEQGQFIGTPEYMSPEQAGMTIQDIDTRSDVYSLGVVLYELLTSTLPFTRDELERAGFAEIQRIIRETDPPRPSTRLSSLGEEAKKVAEKRHTEVTALTKRLHKELEWIPLKAMRKEPDRRYKTASELADDVRNYLNGDPLMAGPESVAYRAKKFARRNLALVAGIAAVLAVLVAGVVVSTIFAFGQARARTEAQRQGKVSKMVADFLKNDVLASADPNKARSPEVPVHYILDAASENLEGKFENEPLVEASIRETLGVTYRKLGKFKTAEQHIERALQIHKNQLGNEHPDTIVSMGHLGWLYFDRGRYDEAEELLVEALEISCRLLGENHSRTTALMGQLAWVYIRQERYDEAEELFAKALETYHRANGEECQNVADITNGIATLHYSQGRYDEAEQLYVKALGIYRRVLGEEHWTTLNTMRNLANIYGKQGRYSEAEKFYREVLEFGRHVLGEEHPSTLTSMHNLAWLYHIQGRYDEAESLYVNTLEISRRVLGEEHESTLLTMRSLASLYQRMDRYEDAETLYLQALEISSNVSGEEHETTLRSMRSLASLYKSMDRYEDAERMYLKALETSRSVLGEAHEDTLHSMRDLASLYERKDRYEDAERVYLKVLETSRSVLGEEHGETLRSMIHLASFYEKQDRYEDAETLYLNLPEISMRNLARLYRHQGNAYRKKGAYDLAISDYTKAIEINPEYYIAYRNRGYAYSKKGEYDLAISDYTKAIEIDPEYAYAYRNRGDAYREKGENDLAISDYTKAIEIDPEYAYAYDDRGSAYDKKGEHDLAIADFTKVIEIKPRDVIAYRNRGDAYREKGEYDLAIADFTKAIEIRPRYTLAYNNCAWLYATCPVDRFRNGQKAVELATKACELTNWDDGWYFDTLAAAYAEIDDFESAVKWQEKAISLLKEDDASEEERKDYENRLKLYQSGKPYREIPRSE